MAYWHAETIEASYKNFKFSVFEGKVELLNFDFLKRLKDSEAFRNWYSNTLTACGFDAFFWENRPFTMSTLFKPYECNIVHSTYLASQAPDTRTFRDYFEKKEEVVSFMNLGNDARLIVPVPSSHGDDFAHLARFLRNADINHINTFWKTVADATLQRISQKPVWLSTSGLGVYWLHVRIDTYPKYYQTEEYKTL